MKIYALPTEVPAPEPDYSNYDYEKEVAQEDAHLEALKKHFIAQGYRGKNTGEVISFPVADGCAQYMLVEGPKSFLIHLPYGDAWQFREAEYLPKKEILRRIESGKKLAKLFGGK